jgi:hypothetical protein
MITFHHLSETQQQLAALLQAITQAHFLYALAPEQRVPQIEKRSRLVGHSIALLSEQKARQHNLENLQYVVQDHAIALLEAEQRWLDDVIAFPDLTAGAASMQCQQPDSDEGRPQTLRYIISIFLSTKKTDHETLFEEIAQSPDWQSYDHAELYVQRDLIVACLDILAEQIADGSAGDLIRIVVQDHMRIILAAELAWLEGMITISC